MFLFGFNKFIAPTIIKALYFVSLVTVFFGGAGVIVYAIAEMENLGGKQAGVMITAAAVGTPFMILFVRFVTEMWLVMFEMNKRLADFDTSHPTRR
jgi:hypothetical protein